MRGHTLSSVLQNMLKNNVFGSFNLNNSEKYRLSFEEVNNYFLSTSSNVLQITKSLKPKTSADFDIISNNPLKLTISM